MWPPQVGEKLVRTDGRMRCLPAEKSDSDWVEEPLIGVIRSDETLMAEIYSLRFDWNQTADDFFENERIFYRTTAICAGHRVKPSPESASDH